MSPVRAKKEAEKQAVLFEQKVLQGILIPTTIKFAEFAERYFEDYGNDHLRPRTLAEYKRLMKRINKEIGHIRLDKLHPLHLAAFYRKLAAEGIRQDAKTKPIIDIRVCAQKAGFKQKDLSKETGLHQNTLRQAYCGRIISIDSAKMICTALQMDFAKSFSVTKQDKPLAPSTIKNIMQLFQLFWLRLLNGQCLPIIRQSRPIFQDRIV